MTEIFAGRYRLLRLLGRGGMGEVYLARDLAHGGECALKRLSARSGSGLATVRREFELLTRLRHPAVVSVLEFGTSPEGTPYYTMEYVPGLPAHEAILPGQHDALFFFAAEVAAGLEALHGLSVFHGDLKPTNVLVIPGAVPGRPTAVRLLDFGLGAALGSARAHRGTAGYAAPEVVAGHPIGTAADLYGLGATLYTLGAGRLAFPGEIPNDVLRSQQAGPPRTSPLEQAGVPRPLVELILRLLARDPRDRPQGALEVRRELEAMHPAAWRPLDVRVQTAVFVGRERELAAIEQRRTSTARPRVLVIRGESGIGKSALLRELVLRGTLAARPVLHFACGALQGRWAAGGALLRCLEVEAGGERTNDAAAGGAEPFETGADLATLADRAVACLRRIAERAGTPIVLLDDVDRLDPLSRAFVRRLVLHPGARAALWLWTRRATGGEAPDDERALLESGVAEPLDLRPLARDGVTRMIAARLSAPAPRDLEEFLWARAAGHAGLTVELLRYAAARGALRESDAGLVVDFEALAALELPPGFEALVAMLHDSLSPPARAAAAALAVLGRPARPGETGAIATFCDPHALDELVASGLAVRDAAGAVSIGSPAFADRLAASVPEALRRTLHRAALEDSGLSHGDRFRHLEAAGDHEAALAAAEDASRDGGDAALAVRAARLAERAAPERAGVWHERAGRELSRAGRYRTAIPHLERAFEAAPQGKTRRIRTALLSNALLRAGELDALERLHVVVLPAEEEPGARARLLVNESSRLAGRGDHEGARALALEALALAGNAGDDEASGLAAQWTCYLLLGEERHDEAESMARRAVEAFERAGIPASRLRAIGAVAEVARARHRLGVSERLYREALGEARGRGLRLVVEELLVNLASVLGHLGRWSESRERYAEAARLALEDERPRGAAVAFANLAQLDGLMGRGRLARRQARAAIRLARAHHPPFEAVGWRSLSQGHRVSGRWRTAARAARRALDLAARMSGGDESLWCRVELGRVLAESNRWSEALAAWKPGVAGPGLGVRTAAEAALGLCTGRAALRGGDLAYAQARLAAAEELLAGKTYAYVGALAAQLRAEIAILRIGLPEAAGPIDRALDALLDLRAAHDRACALLEFGALGQDPKRAGGRRAGEWIDEAAAAFERLGNRPARVRALELQVEGLKRGAAPAGGERGGRDLIDSVSRLLHSMSDLKELTQRAMRLVVEQLDATRGVLLLEDPESGEFVPMAEHGELDHATRSNAVGYSRQVVQRVRSSGGSLLIADAPSDPTSLSESMEYLKLRSVVCVPMFIGGRVIGTVYLDDSRRAQAFDEQDRALLEGFAHLMAIAIDRSRGEDEVRRANEMLVGENLSLRQEAGVRFQADRLIGTSLEMQRIRAMIERLAQNQSTVLLTGENGTGKELIARIVHHSGRRRLKPFVAINCGAIPEPLLEAELFGILNNVATNVRARDGRFKQADGGTLFLDEIGDMPLNQQVALLAAIANREITPVGGARPIPVDVRLMAATNRDLARMVAEGTFREDLYYRLNVIPIEVPPLRNRKADVPMLTRHFVEQFARLQERPVPELSNEFLAALMQSDWAGNVRELQNYVERVMAMNPGDVLYPSPPPRDLEERGAPFRAMRRRGLTQMVEELERKAVQQALENARGNQSLAARHLGITEQSIRYRIRKYKLGSARQNQRVRRFRH